MKNIHSAIHCDIVDSEIGSKGNKVETREAYFYMLGLTRRHFDHLKFMKVGEEGTLGTLEPKRVSCTRGHSGPIFSYWWAFIDIGHSLEALVSLLRHWPASEGISKPLDVLVDLQKTLSSLGYMLWGETLLWRHGSPPRGFRNRRLHNMKANTSLEAWSPSGGFCEQLATELRENMTLEPW